MRLARSFKVFDMVAVDSASSRLNWGTTIRGLEECCVYPLGADAFQLDHGPDYFRFFDRIASTGNSTHHLAVSPHGSILAQACVVHQVIPPCHRSSTAGTPCSYVADFKVEAALRQQGLGTTFLERLVLDRLYKVPRAMYGISMNPPDRPNVVKRCAVVPCEFRADLPRLCTGC
jgi:hypothetical protein